MNSPTTILLLLKRVDCNDGVSTYLETLISGLREQGDRIVIVSGAVTSNYGSERRRRSIEGGALEWLVLDGFSTSLPNLSHLQRVLALIDRYGIDVLSPQGFSVLPIAFLAGRLRGRPVVTNFHLLPRADPASHSNGELSAKQQLTYFAVNAACRSDRYIAMSTEIEGFFHKTCGIPMHQIRKQMLGVETAFYRIPTDAERKAARMRFGLTDAAFATVLPGRMNLIKGHDVAAAAFRILRAKRKELTTVCFFAGDGDDRERIEADVLRDDVDRNTFRFLGFVDQETMRDAYWAADTVILPSRSEGFPLVIIEAMCCGSIVIRTPTSGWQDQVIEGETGYVVPFNDPHALAAAIETVVDSPHRAAMRDAAMRLASTSFSKSRMIDGTASIYREAADLWQPARAALVEAS
jgi:glycosyltransferase involved in cell wall biosynthesis